MERQITTLRYEDCVNNCFGNVSRKNLYYDTVYAERMVLGNIFCRGLLIVQRFLEQR
jgi:hypothetical protein